MTSVKTDRLFIIHYLTKQVAIKFALTEHHTFYTTSSETSHTTSSSIIESSNATSLPEASYEKRKRHGPTCEIPRFRGH